MPLKSEHSDLGYEQTKEEDIAFRKVENRVNFKHAKVEAQKELSQKS